MKIKSKLLLSLLSLAPLAVSFSVISCKTLDKKIDQPIVHVHNFCQLKNVTENNARLGIYDTKTIIIDEDIVCSEPIYIMNDTTIVCNENHSITRDSNFLDDLFVVGEDENGNNPILSSGKAILTIKTNSDDAVLTIDGNKDNITSDIHGSAIFVSNHSEVNLNKNVIIQNFRKDTNVRALTKRISYPKLSGGAAIMITSGTFNMYGGTIDNCLCPEQEESEEKAYMGGAIYCDSGFNMYGGTISNCSAARGGALYDYSTPHLVSGLITKCHATEYGGAIYLPDSQYANIILGSTGTSVNKMNITENTSDLSGGAIFSKHKSVVYSLGNCVFDNNSAGNNGGAIASSGSVLLDNTIFTNNKATGEYGKGGAIYSYADDSTLAIRETQLNNCEFKSNSSVYSGGALTFDAGDESVYGAVGKINNTTFKLNTSAKGGAICAQALSDVEIKGSTFDQNTTTSNGAAIYNTNSSVKLLKSDTTNTIANNTTPEKGGGIAVHSGGTVTLEQATFDQNTADANGGALYLYGGSANITSSNKDDVVFTGNKAKGGGAIYICSTDDNEAVLNATYINASDNTATSNGGALYAYTNAFVYVTNLYLTSNSATTYGGGIYSSGESKIVTDYVEAKSNSATSGGFVYITTAYTEMIIKSGLAQSNTCTSAGKGSTLWANAASVVVKIKGKTSQQYFVFDGEITGKSGFEVQDYEE